MKKLKLIMGAVMRAIILLAPGAVFLSWAWSKVPAWFSILASIGIESIYLMLFAITVTVIQAAKNIKKEKEEAEPSA
jgi:predicted RND superfamily exporter protein